jgi:hypothetical protein
VNSSDIGEINEAHGRLVSAAQTPQSIVLMGTDRPVGYGYDQEMRPGTRIGMPATAPQAAAASQARPTAQQMVPTTPAQLPPRQQQPPAGRSDGAVA